jgi:hypothetical protein
MALPPKLFYPIAEIATRWSVSPLDIVGWAIDGRISLSAALPLVEARRSRLIEGLVEIAGQDVFDLFGAGTKKKSTVRIHRFRRRPGARWEKILNPTEGVTLKPSGVLITRTEAERFEREHRVFGYHAAGNDQHPAKTSEILTGQSGAPARYDWNAFAGAVARRVHDEGMPASQGELVRDMLDWFAASGAVPDESTVRRRVQALWAVLTKKKAG